MYDGSSRLQKMNKNSYKVFIYPYIDRKPSEFRTL